MRTKNILLNSLIEQTSVCESNEFSVCDKQTYKGLRRFAIAKLDHLKRCTISAPKLNVLL